MQSAVLLVLRMSLITVKLADGEGKCEQWTGLPRPHSATALTATRESARVIRNTNLQPAVNVRSQSILESDQTPTK